MKHECQDIYCRCCAQQKVNDDWQAQIDALRAENEILRRLAKEGTRLHCCGMCKHCQEVSEVLGKAKS